MVLNKALISTVKKELKRFTKNVSFSGVESKKSPKSRRKSIATVLPTPLKKKKKEPTSLLNEWIVSDSSVKDAPVKEKKPKTNDLKEQGDLKLVASTPLTKTPKTKKKKSDNSKLLSKQRKSLNKNEESLPHIDSSTISKKKTESLTDTFDTSEIDETDEKFGIGAKHIAEAIQSVVKLRLDNPKLQNQLFDDPILLFLNISCHKVPRGPSRIIRIELPNSILTPDDEVCLIVPEVKGIKNIEHDKHLEHYENLLQKKGVENINKVMTFHQFRTEYETYEQKRRLVDLYDMFLVDGRISGKVVKKCGKLFYKKRKVPTAVKLQATKLKEHINKALSKAFLLLHLKGDSYSVQFGHNKMPIQDLVDNVFAVVECLDKEFPGGFPNIKGLNIFTMGATSIPIYSSFTFPKEIKTPQVTPKKPKAYETFTGELTTLLDAEVKVLPTGQVFVKRANENAIKVKDGKKKVRKTRKRKQIEAVSDEAIENVEETSNEKVAKKKRKKTVVDDEQNAEENSNQSVEKNKQKTKKNKVKSEKITKIEKKEVKKDSIGKKIKKKVKN